MAASTPITSRLSSASPRRFFPFHLFLRFIASEHSVERYNTLFDPLLDVVYQRMLALGFHFRAGLDLSSLDFAYLSLNAESPLQDDSNSASWNQR